MEAVVRSANRTLVLVSGGSMAGDEALLEKARQSLEAGATGLVFGRNIWQREHDESLRLISKLQEILVKRPTCSIASWERRHGSSGENMIFPS
jgi:class I fructose-bisphosphate aldolase